MQAASLRRHARPHRAAESGQPAATVPAATLTCFFTMFTCNTGDELHKIITSQMK